MHKRRLRALSLIALASATALVMAGCSSPGSGSSTSGSTGSITFVGPTDTVGLYKQLVGEWNSAHPKEKVTYVPYSSAASDDIRAELVQNFQAKSGRFDVIFTNNVWTDEFAARKWIDQLNPSDYSLSKMLKPPQDTGQYNGKLYAVPFTTDGGMLYYRKDLVSTPPKTFDEMQKDCQTNPSIPCYAGQYAQYDGLTVNFTEAVADAGGTVTDEKGNPTVDTPQAKKGLQVLVDGFKDGWIPKDAITFKEDDGRIAFQNGQLQFLNNWSYVDALASKPDSKVAGKYGMATLPGIDGPGKSALGGWNLTVNTYSKNKSTDVQFINWLTQKPQQKLLLAKAANAPVWASLYDDPSLIAKFPFLPTLKQSLSTAVPLPKTTNWAGTSLAIQKNAYAALQGTVSVDQALKQMQSDMEAAQKDQ